MTRTEKFPEFIEITRLLFSPLHAEGIAYGIFDEHGQAYYLEPTHWTDCGTLEHSVQTASQYIQLSPGSWLLAQDFTTTHEPSCRLDFIYKLESGGYFIARLDQWELYFSPLNLPPVPIKDNSGWNEGLLDHMQTQGHLKASFRSSVQQKLLDLESRIRSLEALMRVCGLHERKVHKHFQSWSAEIANHITEDLADGEILYRAYCQEDLALEIGLQHQMNELTFKLSPVNSFSSFTIPHSATWGVVASLTLRSLNPKALLNSFSLKGLSAHIPQNSWVSAEGLKKADERHFEGVSFLCLSLRHALACLDPRYVSADPAPGLSLLHLEFAHHPHLTLPFLGGHGGGPHQRLSLSDAPWITPRPYPCPETLEAAYPIEILGWSRHHKSGGLGLYPGSDGCRFKLRVLQPARLRWSLPGHIKSSYGASGGKSTGPGELFIIRPGSQTELLSATSNPAEAELQAHDVVLVTTPGGGGRGQAPTSPVTDKSGE